MKSRPYGSCKYALPDTSIEAQAANLRTKTPASLTMSSNTLPRSSSSTHLPVAPERQGVLSLPGLSATGLGVVVSVTLGNTTVVLASGGQTAEFAVLVDWVGDPVDAGIATDGLVLRVDEDDLEVLVGRVLVDPVGVEDTQVGATATDTLLSDGAEGALELELVHTLVGWLAWSEDQYRCLCASLAFSIVP